MSPEPADSLLQAQLLDLLELVLVGQHMRWTLTGPRAEQLRARLGEMVEAWRSWAEVAAGQMVDNGTPPDGRLGTLAGRPESFPLRAGWTDAVAALDGLCWHLEGLARRSRGAALATEGDWVARALLQRVADTFEWQHRSLLTVLRER